MEFDDDVRAAFLEALDAEDERLAIEILLAAYGEVIYGYSRRMLGSGADAEDVLQNVFLQAYERVWDLRDLVQLRAWLLVVARNRCVDRLRAGQRARSSIVEDDASMAACPVDFSPGDPLLRTAIEHCLDALDQRSRAAVILRLVDQLSYEEISAITSDSPGALRVRVSRSLPALRECLKARGLGV